MKNLLLFWVIAVLLTMSSCKNKKTPNPVPATPPIENPTPKPSPKTNSATSNLENKPT